MTIWKMIAHHTDRAAAVTWTRDNRRIAIGWGKIGDLARYNSIDEIKAAIKDSYPIPPYKNNAHLGAPSLWDFANTMKKGDLVIVLGNKPREFVVEIVGDTEFVADDSPLEGEYHYQRAVELTEVDAEKLWLAAGQAPGKSRYQTLVACQNSVDVNQEIL